MYVQLIASAGPYLNEDGTFKDFQCFRELCAGTVIFAAMVFKSKLITSLIANFIVIYYIYRKVFTQLKLGSFLDQRKMFF